LYTTLAQYSLCCGFLTKNFKQKVMKARILRWTLAVGLVTASASNIFAQMSLGVQGGLAKSNRDNSKTVAGGGLNLRFFPSEMVAIGVAGKIYADGTEYRIAGQDVSFNGRVMPVTGTLDFFLLPGVVKPYLGGDAGMYFSKYDARFNGSIVSESSRHSNFGAAPRAGVIFAFGNVGLQVEGIYHFIFGNKNNSAQTGTADNVDYQSTSQFGGINVGLIFGLGKSK
jgi:hypothetical protein